MSRRLLALTLLDHGGTARGFRGSGSTAMAPHLRLVSAPTQSDTREPDNLTAFLAALTALSERYGIAVADGAELFEMEPDDRLSSYHADAESRLTRA